MTREDALRQLFGAPLPDFIAERKRLVAELKAAGAPDAAAEIGKLAKPSPAAWALNHVARAAPDELGAWLAVAAELRDASTRSAEVGGDALRAAMAAHRTATARLRGVVREQAQPTGKPLSESMLDRVAALLQAATADAESAERLRLGLVTEDKVAPPAVKVPTTADQGARPPGPDREAKARAKAERERRERLAALDARAESLREELGRVREQLEERKAAHRAAMRRQEEARRALRRSESEVSAAEAAVTESEDDIATHERELAMVREQLRGT